MRECRTTHYEGCACHEERHAAEVAALRARNAALEAVARAAVAEYSLHEPLMSQGLRDAVRAMPEALRKELAGPPIDWDAPIDGGTPGREIG